MTAPFQPKGAVAEWRLLYEILVPLEADEILTTDQIEEALGRELGQNRTPIYRATRELERNQHRTLATVRGVGYRVAKPEEHLGLSLSHSGRARKAMKRGVERSEAADRALLSAGDATRLEAFEAHASRVVMFLGRMARTVDDHTAQITAVQQDAADTTARVAVMEDALQRHGLMD